jgi:hypothetical protein
MAQGSMARRSTIGDKVDGTTISMTPATRRYTHTSMTTVEKVFSPGLWSVEWWCSALKWASGSKVD